MTAIVFSIFRNAGPPIANHLWQSTAFVLAVGLLALLFGKNRARIRYGLWLAASVKFLIPFSLLITLGSLISTSNDVVPVLQPSLISAATTVSQPFSADVVMQRVQAQSLLQRVDVWLPAALALIWALGFAAVLLAWYTRWKQVSRMLQRAVPAEEGHEVEILRRIERGTRARTRIRFLVSSDLMEPGIFGILRPVLLWPAQLSDRLEDAHLEAILAHENIHVLRRDNFTALIHMVVEAIFWFHPFVWWIERKMMEERERACDEAVVWLGSRAEVYADSLLKVSRFCAELPLPCVSGITGSDLSKRIRSVMTGRVAEVGYGQRLLLAVLTLSAIVGPVALGLMQATPLVGQILHATGPLPSFEVASIRPDHSGSRLARIESAGLGAPNDRFIATNITVKMLVCWAFSTGNLTQLRDNQISGGPSWISSERYDIDAKLEDSQTAALDKLSPRDRVVHIKLMVQSLLVNRFDLVAKSRTVIRPVYALVIAKGGPKLQETVPGSTSPIRFRGRPVQTLVSRGEIRGHAMSISTLADRLSGEGLGRPILDQTGLKGKYDLDLKWTPTLSSSGTTPSPGAEPAPPDTSGPSIFTAVQEQLGLKLESTKGPVAGVVIAHIEEPSEN